MNTLKILGILVVFGFMETFGSIVGEQLSIPGSQHLLQSAEARVGRPLTPVSVAGAARRTVRRCAVGVYNCGLPPGNILEGKSGQLSINENAGNRKQALLKQTS